MASPHNTLKIDVAIKTIDRSPKKNYLNTTLKNLARGGVFNSSYLGRFTIVDGGSSDPLTYIKEQCAGIPTEERRVEVDLPDEGQRRTYHQNAQRAIYLASQGWAQYALVLEDDIDVCADFLGSVARWLLEYETNTPMMYAFGANYVQIRDQMQRGHNHWYYPVDGFYGALACAWRREVAADLADWLGPDPFLVNKKGEQVRTHGHDLILALWGKIIGLSHFLASAPCFVQHIGVESGLNNKQIVYKNFAGPNWKYAPKQKAAS